MLVTFSFLDNIVRFMALSDVLPKIISPGNMQQTDEDKKGLWKTLMDRFSSKPEDGPPPEKSDK